MGQISSSFQLENERDQLPPNLTPARADWITAHAVVTKLAIVEIERSWKRFQQLGCNSKGDLTDAAFKKHPLLQHDIFAKNILTTLKSANGNVTFLTYLNCMKWADAATHEDKIIAVFNLLNKGDPINRDLLLRLIKRLYPQDKSRHELLTDVLMEQLCGQKNGTITSEVFVERVKSLPQEIIDGLFNFLIVPAQLADEARQNFTALSKYGNQPPPQGSTPDLSNQMPTDGVLNRIADKIHKRDWQILGNRLGFTQSQITEFDSNSDTPQIQVLTMLKAWRNKEGTSATCGVLEEKLQQCDMADAALLLYP